MAKMGQKFFFGILVSITLKKWINRHIYQVFGQKLIKFGNFSQNLIFFLLKNFFKFDFFWIMLLNLENSFTRVQLTLFQGEYGRDFFLDFVVLLRKFFLKIFSEEFLVTLKIFLWWSRKVLVRRSFLAQSATNWKNFFLNFFLIFLRSKIFLVTMATFYGILKVF